MTKFRKWAGAGVVTLALASMLSAGGRHQAIAQADNAEQAATAPGRGPWQAHAQPYYLKPSRVALDADCGDEASADLRPVIEKELARLGIAIDNSARDVLRYSVSPCTALARDRDALVRDAYEGTSRGTETPTLEPQFKLKLGGKAESANRLGLSMILYTPGATPSWRAEASVGRSGANRSVQFNAMAKTMIAAFGEDRAETIFTP